MKETIKKARELADDAEEVFEEETLPFGARVIFPEMITMIREQADLIEELYHNLPGNRI